MPPFFISSLSSHYLHFEQAVNLHSNDPNNAYYQLLPLSPKLQTTSCIAVCVNKCVEQEQDQKYN